MTITAHFPPFDSINNSSSVKFPVFAQKLDPYIETYTGKQFHILNPKEEEVNIHDIAHALSNICRFTGHCANFYSVAEHSVYVSYITNSLEGLLHDASEAYLTDVASPIKPYLSNYKYLEENIQKVIYKRFGIVPEGYSVKKADMIQLNEESKHLIPSKGENWDTWKIYKRPTTNGFAPQCYPPELAKQFFKQRFKELYSGK